MSFTEATPGDGKSRVLNCSTFLAQRFPSVLISGVGDDGKSRSRSGAIITLSFIFVAALLTGCTTSYHLASKGPIERFDGGPQKVYVTNPEMREAYDILKASRIYCLTNQPEGARKLTLVRLEQRPGCGMGVLIAIYTLGIIPGEVPTPFVFEYELETDSTVECFQHYLGLYERTSLWEWAWKWNKRRVFATALASSKPQPAETGF